MNIERHFTGTDSIEDILLSILKTQIDRIIHIPYDDNRANTVPSKTDKEGTVTI